MSGSKAALLARDRFQMLVVAWRVAEMIRCHQLGLKGPDCVYVEREHFKGLDDLVERFPKPGAPPTFHAWQVKDQTTTLTFEPVQKILEALGAHEELERAVFFVSHSVGVRVEKGGRKFGELRILRGLCGRLRNGDVEPARLLEQLNGEERKWLTGLTSELGWTVEDVATALGRLKIALGKDGEDVAREGVAALAGVVATPAEAWEALLHFVLARPDGLLQIKPEGVLDGPLATFARAPFRRPRRLTQLCERYLQGLLGAWRTRDVPGASQVPLSELWVDRQIWVGLSNAWSAVQMQGREDALPAELWLQSLEGVVALLGEPGAGKSALLAWAEASMAERSLGDPTRPVPFLIEAEKALTDGVEVSLRAQGGLAAELWQTELKRVLLLDGLDEVPAPARRNLSRWLESLRADDRVQAIVVSCRVSEFVQISAARVDRIVPWSGGCQERFLSNAAEHFPRAVGMVRSGQVAPGLMELPLGATFALIAIERRPERMLRRFKVWDEVLQQLLGWTRQRVDGAEALADFESLRDALAGLALEMLSEGRSAMSGAQVDDALPPLHRRAMLERAERQIGVLVVKRKDVYGFLLRPLAEYLAAFALRARTPEELAELSDAAWAQEVLPHVAALHEQPQVLVEALLRDHELDFSHGLLMRPFHVRRVLCAIGCAAEVEFPEALAHHLADVVWRYLREETSRWVGERVGEQVRRLSAVGGAVWERLRAHALGALANGGRPCSWSGFQTMDAPTAVRWQLHRDPRVRAAAARRLAPLVSEPPLLVGVLRDLDLRALREPAGFVAARLLRGVALPPELHAQLLSWLKGGSQRHMVAAALALRPEGAPLDLLVAAMRELDVMKVDAQDVVLELAEHPGGLDALDRGWTAWRDYAEATPNQHPPSPIVEGDWPPPTPRVRQRLGLLIASDAGEFDPAQLFGNADLLTSLIHLAHRGLDVTERLSAVLILEQRGHSDAEVFLQVALVSPEQRRALADAVGASPIMEKWLLDEFDRVAEKGPGFLWMFPGEALEPLLRRGVAGVEERYALWAPGGVGPMGSQAWSLPLDLARLPLVRDAALARARSVAQECWPDPETGKRLAPSTAAAYFSSLWPTWEGTDVEAVIEWWLAEGEDEELLSALEAYRRSPVNQGMALRVGQALQAKLPEWIEESETLRGSWSLQRALQLIQGTKYLPVVRELLEPWLDLPPCSMRLVVTNVLLPLLHKEDPERALWLAQREVRECWPFRTWPQDALDYKLLLALAGDQMGERLAELIRQADESGSEQPLLEAVQLALEHAELIEPQVAAQLVERLHRSHVSAGAFPYVPLGAPMSPPVRSLDLVDRLVFELGGVPRRVVRRESLGTIETT